MLGRGIGVGMVVGTPEGKRFVALCPMLAQPRMLTFEMSSSMLVRTVILRLETSPGWRGGLGSLG